jgi:hypothetical protein
MNYTLLFRYVRMFSFMLPLAFVMSACDGSGERQDLKSPCVGIEGSPCGSKRSVNDWWLT